MISHCGVRPLDFPANETQHDRFKGSANTSASSGLNFLNLPKKRKIIYICISTHIGKAKNIYFLKYLQKNRSRLRTLNQTWNKIVYYRQTSALKASMCQRQTQSRPRRRIVLKHLQQRRRRWRCSEGSLWNSPQIKKLCQWTQFMYFPKSYSEADSNKIRSYLVRFDFSSLRVTLQASPTILRLNSDVSEAK